MRSHWVLGVGALLLCQSALAADVESELASLREAVSSLQRENAEMREELRRLSDESRRPTAAPPTIEDDSDSDSAPPRLVLNGFADLNAGVTFHDPAGPGSHTAHGFGLGEIDFFVTSRLTDDVSVLSEIALESEDEGTEIDLERIQVAWEAQEWLRLALGRGHTRLGYWNHRFHHGAFLQTTIERPLLYGFEHDSGLLPIHFVGVEASGTFDGDIGALGYALTLANGRDADPTHVSSLMDENHGKSVMLAFDFEPARAPGLVFGVNAGHDRVPAGGSPFITSAFGEWIAGGHVAYDASPFELILEGQWIEHERIAGERRTTSGGAYAQLAYELGRWKPYYRFDWVGIDGDDAWLALSSHLEDARAHTLGVRFDWLLFAAVKLELLHAERDGGDDDAIRSQLSFGF